jgi:hypothetical protein
MKMKCYKWLECYGIYCSVFVISFSALYVRKLRTGVQLVKVGGWKKLGEL